MTSLASATRIEQTHLEFKRVSLEIKLWIDRRTRLDKLQQYHTQLKVLRGVLEAALERLHNEFATLSGQPKRELVFARCRWFERQLVWIQRLWDYFRSKFDQRDDERLGPLLAVADEIVWSCHAEVYRKAGVGPPPPVPLPYTEPFFSPQAVPRAEPPPDLRIDVDTDFFRACLQQLPLPLVTLPPSCIRSPWRLVLLGHEVGHHVQFDLLPSWKLVAVFQELLGAVFESEDEDNAERWRQWGLEIFADAFSICMLGPPAISAMAELEYDEDLAMLRERRGSKSFYPSPALRLALMAQIADELGMCGSIGLGDFLPERLATGSPLPDKGHDLRKVFANDLSFVPKVASAILKTKLDRLDPLPSLCNCNPAYFASNGPVFHWVEALRGRAPLDPEKDLRTARLVISASVTAWWEILSEDDAKKRVENCDLLAANIFSIIPKSREDATRGAESPGKPDFEVLGNKLASLLMQTAPAF